MMEELDSFRGIILRWGGNRRESCLIVKNNDSCAICEEPIISTTVYSISCEPWQFTYDEDNVIESYCWKNRVEVGYAGIYWLFEGNLLRSFIGGSPSSDQRIAIQCMVQTTTTTQGTIYISYSREDWLMIRRRWSNHIIFPYFSCFSFKWTHSKVSVEMWM